MLAAGRLPPAEQGVRLVPVGELARREDPGAVDEPGEVGGGRHVGGGGDQVAADLRVPGEAEEEPAERLLGRRRPGRGALLDALRDADPEPRLGRGARQRRSAVLAPARRRGAGLEPVPLGGGGEAGGLAQGVDLGGGEQRRVVARVARDRQPEALDGVGEEDARSVGDPVAGRQRVEERRQVVAAEVLDEGGEVAGVDSGQRRHHGVRSPVEEAPAQLLAGVGEERLVALVGHRVDPVAQRRPAGAGESGAQPPAVLHLDDVPSRGHELLAPLRDAHPGDHPVERLAVEVDDPQRVAEPLGGGVGDRLPDIALVELGVAEDGDEARRRTGAEVGVDVAARHRREERRRRPQADRAGGEVDEGAVGILGARRVRLQPTPRPQPRKVGAIEVAEQVLDRVEDRRRVRLHRHPVAGVEVGEPERGHHRHQRGARRLVAAHLHPVVVLAVVVGGVDDAHREPEHSALDLLQDAEVERPLVRGQHLRLMMTPGGRRGYGLAEGVGLDPVAPPSEEKSSTSRGAETSTATSQPAKWRAWEPTSGLISTG